MNSHHRKYGNGESHPIPVWNGIFDHYDRMGKALWVFLWLIDRVTKEVDGTGKVLGGMPIKIRQIVESIKGATYQMVRDQLNKLEAQAYIKRTRTPYGFAIEVRNSRKWGIWKRNVTGPTEQSGSVPGEQSDAKRPVVGNTQIGPDGQNKEDTALHSIKETQQPGSSAVWDFLGVDGAGWPPPARELCHNFYREKNGQTPVELIGACMDRLTAMRLRIPAQLARRAAELRKDKLRDGQAIPELEAEPWQN